MPRPISAGVLGIARTMRCAAGGAGQRVAAHAGHHAQVQRLGHVRRAWRGRFGEDLRLHRPHHQLGIGEPAVGLRHRGQAEALLQGLALRLDRLDDNDRCRRPAGFEQAADQRDGHVAATDENDALEIHRGSVATRCAAASTLQDDGMPADAVQ